MCHNFARFGLVSMPNNAAFRFRAFCFLIFIWSSVLCSTCSRCWRIHMSMHAFCCPGPSFVFFLCSLAVTCFLHAYPGLRTDLRDVNVCIFVVDYAGQPKVIGYIIPFIIFFLIHFSK